MTQGYDEVRSLLCSFGWCWKEVKRVEGKWEEFGEKEV